MQWVWLVVVAALVVPHVDGDGRVEGGEEVVGTCGGQRNFSLILESPVTIVGDEPVVC